MKPFAKLMGRRSSLLIVATLLTGALFKLSAFAREAFITAHFGLTSVTDTYFSLQQLPIAVAAFMFGAFSRAFTPVFAESLRDDGRASWLPGLLIYSTFFSLLLGAITLLGASAILNLFARSTDVKAVKVLVILSASYLPIVWIGICSSVWMSYGKSLASMTLTGLPYLVMTLTLVAIYLMGFLGDLSLPISMTAGFFVVGGVGLVAILKDEKPFRDRANVLSPWRVAHFRQFAGQLLHSSIETLGYTANQFTLLYFLARSGTGAISANTCATRIGTLGFSLLSLPLIQFMQGRLCLHQRDGQRQVIKTYLLGMAVCTSILAGVLYLFRTDVTEFVYMRGKFSRDAIGQVVELLPAWLSYFVVLSMNGVASRYLFTISKGALYNRNMLCGYAGTNALRFIVAGRMPPSAIIWCAVLAEGCAFGINLRACLAGKLCSEPMSPPPDTRGSSEMTSFSLRTWFGGDRRGSDAVSSDSTGRTGPSVVLAISGGK